MRLLITNTVASNGGDAAILFGMISALKEVLEGNVQFTVLDSNSETVSELYPELDVRPTVASRLGSGLPSRGRLTRLLVLAQTKYRERWLCHGLRCWTGRGRPPLWRDTECEWLNLYRSADVVISTGGTYLTSNYRLAPRLLEFEAARATGTPLILYTQSIGPLRRRDALDLVAYLGYACVTMVRDGPSARLLEELGVPAEKILRTADAAFALPGEEISRFRVRGNPFVCGKPLKIGFSVRRWRHFRSVDSRTGQTRYRRSLASLVELLVNQYNAKIFFLSTCQGVSNYGFDDSEEAEIIRGHLTPAVQENVYVDHTFHRPEELIRAFGSMDMMIATRMHAVILALLGGTPVLPISYEFKTAELYDRFGMPEYVVEIDQLDHNRLIDSVNRFIMRYDVVCQVFANEVKKARNEAIEAAQTIAEMVRGVPIKELSGDSLGR